MERYDVIVIGAGLNGLAAAAYIAKGGLSTLVLEGSDRIGGSLARRKIGSDFTVSQGPRTWRAPDPQILVDLGLARYGLQILPPAGSLTLLPNGDYVADYAAPHSHYEELVRHSRRDADAFPRYRRDLQRLSAWISARLERLPKDPAIGRLPGRRWWDHWHAAMGELGSADMKMIQMFTRACGYVLEAYFESPAVRIHALGSALFGTPLGPYSPGTTHLLALREMARRNPPASWSYVRGGDGALAGALADCIAAHDGKIRTGAPVAEIRIQKNRAVGVVLDDGEEIDAATVVSDLSLDRTFLSLCSAQQLPNHFVEAIRAFNSQGTIADLAIALDGLPEMPAVPKDCPALTGEILFPGDLAQVDQAFESWAHDRVPEHPHISISIPSLLDPTISPPGQHVMSVLVHYVSGRPADGPWTEDRAVGFRDTILRLVERHVPKLSDHIVGCEIRTPADLEAISGHPGGNPFEGDLTLEQFALNRPAPGLSGPDTPVSDLLVSTAGAFGGMGLAGSAGAAAAAAAIESIRRKAGRQ